MILFYLTLRIGELMELIANLRKRHKALVEEKEFRLAGNLPHLLSHEFEIRVRMRELNNAWKDVNYLNTIQDDIENKLKDLEKNPPRFVKRSVKILKRINFL